MSVDLERVKREGRQLEVGIYELGETLHVDLEEFMLASGLDPADKEHVEQACAVIAEVAEEQGIEVGVREI